MKVERIRDCMPTDNSIFSRLSHIYGHGLDTDSTNFPLLQLPPELRLLVYAPLITSGDLSIMRISKLVHDEAVNLLKTHAVLRLFLRYAHRTSSALPFVPLVVGTNLKGSLTVYAPPVIQRIELHLNQVTTSIATGPRTEYPFRRFDVYAALLKSFGGRDVARQSCIIYLELGVYDSIPSEEDFSREQAWNAIANLTGFKTLTFTIVRRGDLAYEQANSPVNGMDSYGTTHDYSALGAIMNTALGPATVCKSPTGGDFLAFHPSDFKVDSET